MAAEIRSSTLSHATQLGRALARADLMPPQRRTRLAGDVLDLHPEAMKQQPCSPDIERNNFDHDGRCNH